MGNFEDVEIMDYRIIGNVRRITHEAWLELREGGIGGSDSAAACGKCPWTSKLDLFDYKTKTKKRTFSQEALKRMRRGNKLEPWVVDHFFLQHEEIEKINFPWMLRSIKYPWMLANIDGAYTKGDIKGVLEIKTARCNWKTYNSKWKEKPPLNYYFQVQHYLAVTGWDEAVLYAHIELENYQGELIEVKIAEYAIPRNEEFIDYIVNETKEFYDAWKADDRIAILNTL